MKKTDLNVRIVAGKYKGKTLQLPSLQSTRSTKSILKDSLFDTLQFDIVGENFIEAFGGSGSVGLEAVSRGAKHAYFIEFDKKAYDILCANCIRIAPKETTCKLGDTFILLPQILQQLNAPAYIYLDPPFSIRENFENVYEKLAQLIAKFSREKVHMFIIEHMSDFQVPKQIASFTCKKTRKFGKSSLSYYM
ncbi:MAG: 16S rRNA (guanine(966)-N(2))-methyltransferase RsmD [Sulfurospirillum sp.]|nr:16S rRNA (guanine(966)-N(2))-methyltransferase RsmD [Sulfurospirillum sp.]